VKFHLIAALFLFFLEACSSLKGDNFLHRKYLHLESLSVKPETNQLNVTEDFEESYGDTTKMALPPCPGDTLTLGSGVVVIADVLWIDFK